MTLIKNSYTNRKVGDFLQLIGQGKGMPGSGCAAALSALMGISLLQSACKITLNKENYSKSHKVLADALQLLTNNHLPTLTKLMQQDADAVQAFLKEKKISEELTATPMLICKNSIEALEIGVQVFDNTFAPMLGDSATALSLLDSAANATLFICKQNARQAELPESLIAVQKRYEAIKIEVDKRQKN